MPGFLLFSVVGTAAMIWVGGGIIVHGLEAYGLTSIAHVIHAAGEAAAHALPAIGGAVGGWLKPRGAGVFGLVIGIVAIPVAGFVIAPAWKALKRALRLRERAA